MYNKVVDKVIIVLGLIGLLFLWGLCINAFAGGVIDDNNNNAGSILVGTGENNGKSSVGHWTDPSDIPELKGDKGDIGPQGIQGLMGPQGIAGSDGIDGIDGINGIDGYTPVKGVDYFDGKDGSNGVKGDKGDKGDTGKQGKRGKRGFTGTTGAIGVDGAIGATGLNGKDVDPATVDNLNSQIANTNSRIDSLSNRLSKLERTQFVAEFDFRVYDSKRLTISPFFRQNFTRGKIDTVGVRFTIKLGKSYEEKLIEKQNARLDYIETVIRHAPLMERTIDSNGKTTSLRITQNGMQVDGTF